MIRVDTSEALRAIVEAALPVGSEYGLYVHVDLRLYNPRDEEQRWCSRNAHFIISRKTNYTKVWCVVNDDWGMPNLDAFAMTSDHDSCWRTDGFQPISTAYFEMAKSLMDADQAPKDMREWVSFHSVERLDLAYEKDQTDRLSHRKIITKAEYIQRKF